MGHSLNHTRRPPGQAPWRTRLANTEHLLRLFRGDDLAISFLFDPGIEAARAYPASVLSTWQVHEGQADSDIKL